MDRSFLAMIGQRTPITMYERSLWSALEGSVHHRVIQSERQTFGLTQSLAESWRRRHSQVDR
jgi:hypothetical protein